MSNDIQAASTDGAFSLTPSTLDQAMKLAEIMADSDFVPKDFKGKPGNVLVAVQMGAEIGLQPMQAVQNITVINGRPCVWGDSMLAICQSHSDFADIQETDDGSEATCVVKRRGRSDTIRAFSMQDASDAGLLRKDGPWKTYPKRMRQMRARAFALRDSFSDALRGLSSAEEISDIHPVERDMGPADVVREKQTSASGLVDKVKNKKEKEGPDHTATEKKGASFANGAAPGADEVFRILDDATSMDDVNLALSLLNDNMDAEQRKKAHEKAKKARDRIVEAA